MAHLRDDLARPVTACCGALVTTWRPFDCVHQWLAYRVEADAIEGDDGSSLDPADPSEAQVGLFDDLEA